MLLLGLNVLAFQSIHHFLNCVRFARYQFRPKNEYETIQKQNKPKVKKSIHRKYLIIIYYIFKMGRQVALWLLYDLDGTISNKYLNFTIASLLFSSGSMSSYLITYGQKYLQKHGDIEQLPGDMRSSCISDDNKTHRHLS